MMTLTKHGSIYAPKKRTGRGYQFGFQGKKMSDPQFIISIEEDK